MSVPPRLGQLFQSDLHGRPQSQGCQQTWQWSSRWVTKQRSLQSHWAACVLQVASLRCHPRLLPSAYFHSSPRNSARKPTVCHLERVSLYFPRQELAFLPLPPERVSCKEGKNNCPWDRL